MPLLSAVGNFCVKTRNISREVASVIGTLISTFPVFQFDPLHFRHEHDKMEALRRNWGDSEAKINGTLSGESRGIVLVVR